MSTIEIRKENSTPWFMLQIDERFFTKWDVMSKNSCWNGWYESRTPYPCQLKMPWTGKGSKRWPLDWTILVFKRLIKFTVMDGRLSTEHLKQFHYTKPSLSFLGPTVKINPDSSSRSGKVYWYFSMYLKWTEGNDIKALTKPFWVLTTEKIVNLSLTYL